MVADVLVIFDCDGVLVDSEALAAGVFAEQLREHGIALTAGDCQRLFRGHTLPYCFAELNRNYPHRLPADFPVRLSQATRAAFNQSLRPVAGVERVVQWLGSQGDRVCVASNGSAEKIRHSLQLTGLMPYFAGCYFSAEAVIEGKPAPHLFLYAAQRLGFAAADAIVIEDSVAGVAAALAAGMRVCLFQTPAGGEKVDNIVHHQRVSCFESMDQLPALLTALKQAGVAP